MMRRTLLLPLGCATLALVWRSLKSLSVPAGMPSLVRSIRGFLDFAPAQAREVGWPRVLADRVYRRTGLDVRPAEFNRWADGARRRVACRIGTADAFEFDHLLGPARTVFDFPLTPATIIDAGANVGYSVLRLRAEFPDAVIVALEPEPANIAQFKKNCGHDGKVVLEEKALWRSAARLRIRSLDTAVNSFQVEEAAGGDIAATTVPALMAKYDWPRVGLLKVDVEGSEREIFGDAGAAAWLPRVDMILIETHDRDVPGCTRAVARALKPLFDDHGLRGEYELYVRKGV
jgi:FkbM family methyltransferase